MKAMKDYLVKVETGLSETKIVLIGGGYISQKLSLILHNRGLSCLIIPDLKELDFSSSPEFIFLFNEGSESLPEIFLNFFETIKTKLIIISIDRPSGENLARQCLSKDIDFCFASIYDLYCGGKSGSALEKVFSEIKNEKIITFKNDQVIVTPIFIDDAIEGLCRIAFSTQTFKKRFFLTGREEVPLVVFADRTSVEAAGVYGVRLNLLDSELTYPEVVRHEKILNRDESYSLLNWMPEVGMSDGIKLVLNLLKPVKMVPKNKPLTLTAESPKVKKKTTLNQ